MKKIYLHHLCLKINDKISQNFETHFKICVAIQSQRQRTTTNMKTRSNNSISNSSNKKLVIKHNSREISKMIIPCSNVSIVDFEHVIAAGAVAIFV